MAISAFGLDTGGEDHQIAFEGLAILELKSADALVAEDREGVGAEMNADAHFSRPSSRRMAPAAGSSC